MHFFQRLAVDDFSGLFKFFSVSSLQLFGTYFMYYNISENHFYAVLTLKNKNTVQHNKIVSAFYCQKKGSKIATPPFHTIRNCNFEIALRIQFLNFYHDR